MSSVIALDHVSKWFFKRDGTRLIAVEDISFEVPEGAFVTIVGPSGGGKSTIFNMIAGLERADAGEVRYRDRPITKPNVGIGYMTQRDALLPWRTVLANIMLPLHIQGVDERSARERSLEIMARVGLSGFAEMRPSELSGGMLKRAALARTLVYDPETLLMDEPFGNIDIQLKLQLHRELLSLWESERKTVVFVTHDLEEAIALSDEVVVFAGRPGRIRALVPIDLPRPRDPVAIRFEPGFQQIHRHLWSLLDSTHEA